MLNLILILVHEFNKQQGYEILDKAYIKNFIRMERSSKWDKKTNK